MTWRCHPIYIYEGTRPTWQLMINRPQKPRVADWFSAWRKPVGKWLSRRAALRAADVDDLAQEVFLRLLRYGDNQVIDNPQSYLFRIAANVANEWQERAAHRHPHDDSWLAELQAETQEEPENATAREVLRNQVRKAVRGLPERQRTVISLHIDDDMTCPEIAQRLNISQRAVQRDLVRAYSQLRLQLDLEDYGSK